MKVDELLKRLETVKIDENIDERRKIAEYLIQTFFDDDKVLAENIFMMKDKTIYTYTLYVDLLRSCKISPDDTFVYIEHYRIGGTSPAKYLYPFLFGGYLLKAYLAKLNFGPDYIHYVAPARGLKYIARVNTFPNAGRVVLEVADLDSVIINLSTSAYSVLITKGRTKDITYDEATKIVSRFLSRKLFAGYDFGEAGKIIRRYYEDNDTSLAKEVEAIRNAYNHIFKPFRIEYNFKTKQFIV